MLDNRLPHYVGVTGVQEPKQIQMLADAASRHEIGSAFPHALMVGALLDPRSFVTGGGVHHAEGKVFRQLADFGVLCEVLATAADLGVIGMVHCELPKVWPGNKGDTAALRSLLRHLAKEGLSPPVQLNGVLLGEEVRELYAETGVPLVFQLRKEITALGEADVLRYVEGVVSSVSKILMDPSAGTGERIDIEHALQWQRAIERRFSEAFTFGYAGGLGGRTTAEIEHTRGVVHALGQALGSQNFSIDVESRVRAPGKVPGTDHLDLKLCDTYLGAVSAGLRSFPGSSQNL